MRQGTFTIDPEPTKWSDYLFGFVFVVGFGGGGLATILGWFAPGTPPSVRFGGGGLFLLAGVVIAWLMLRPGYDRVRVDTRRRRLFFERVIGSATEIRHELMFEDIVRLCLGSQQKDFSTIDNTLTNAEMLWAVARNGQAHLVYSGGHVQGLDHATRLQLALKER